MIGKEVEEAMNKAISKFNFSITEFTVAPQITPSEQKLPYHEWLVEFENAPDDLQKVAEFLDAEMQRQNSYYFDLIEGKVLQPLKISSLKKDSFQEFMKSEGKLGGQNKVPRLSNDRKIADALLQIQPQN